MAKIYEINATKMFDADYFYVKADSTEEAETIAYALLDEYDCSIPLEPATEREMRIELTVDETQIPEERLKEYDIRTRDEIDDEDFEYAKDNLKALKLWLDDYRKQHIRHFLSKFFEEYGSNDYAELRKDFLQCDSRSKFDYVKKIVDEVSAKIFDN